jgi:hypothetical protein
MALPLTAKALKSSSQEGFLILLLIVHSFSLLVSVAKSLFLIIMVDYGKVNTFPFGRKEKEQPAGCSLKCL